MSPHLFNEESNAADFRLDFKYFVIQLSTFLVPIPQYHYSSDYEYDVCLRVIIFALVDVLFF